MHRALNQNREFEMLRDIPRRFLDSLRGIVEKLREFGLSTIHEQIMHAGQSEAFGEPEQSGSAFIRLLGNKQLFYCQKSPDLSRIMFSADQRSQLIQEERIQRESIARQKQMKEVGCIVIQGTEHRHTEPGLTVALAGEVRERHQAARILQL